MKPKDEIDTTTADEHAYRAGQPEAREAPEFMSNDAIVMEMAECDRTAPFPHERYTELAREWDARMAEVAERDANGFKLFDVVESDSKMRPWHGAWRMDGGTNELHTAVFPLNLVMRAYWAVVILVKVGNVTMGADPRAAFIDGYEAGLRDGPGNILAQQKALESQEEALREFADLLGEREAKLRRDMAELANAKAASNAAG